MKFKALHHLEVIPCYHLLSVRFAYYSPLHPVVVVLSNKSRALAYRNREKVYTEIKKKNST